MQGGDESSARARLKKHRRPSDLSLSGWLSVLHAAARGMGRHQVSIDAAAISFLTLFAMFSAVSAFVAFYGLWADPTTVVHRMQTLAGFVPADVVISMVEQMRDVARRAAPILWGAGTFSAVLGLWCAQQGVRTLMVSLNAAYSRPRVQHGWRHTLRSFALAVAIVAGLVCIALLVIGLPVAIQMTWHDLWLSEWMRGIGMALGGLCLFFGLAAVYRWVPDRPSPSWRWVWIGAAMVVVFWTVASSLFSIFLSYSNSYTVMYGSLSAVMLMLTLTYVTVASVLVGAEFNAQLEVHCDMLEK